MEEKYTSVCVRYRSHRWEARLTYYENGERKELAKKLPEAKGKREAERMAEDLRRELNATAEKTGDAGTEKTVDEVVRSYIEHQYAIGILESSTYNTQLKSYERNIKPYLGDYVFNTLDRTAIIDWHTKLSNKGLTQHAIYYNYTIITKVYNYYVDIGEINRNPFHSVKGLVKSKKNRITHLTKEQMENFLNKFFEEFEPKDQMYPAIALAFYGGLRRSEICGLRYNDIDFEGNTLTVSSAVAFGVDGSYTKGTKNASSHRTFPMMPQLAKCLKLRYEAVKPKSNWFVCGDGEKYIAPNTFSHYFNRFVVAYDLRDAYGKYITPHGLRHNLATVGMRSNMDIAALSLMMGHASRSMTLDIYGDANEQSKLLAVEKLSNTFSKDTDDMDYYPNEEPEEAE